MPRRSGHAPCRCTLKPSDRSNSWLTTNESILVGGETLTGNEFGALIRRRREALGLGLDDVSKAVGGTPGPGFLGNMELGSVGPSTSLILRLGGVLDLPSDQMLNAAGYATESQRVAALGSLAERIGGSGTQVAES